MSLKIVKTEGETVRRKKVAILGTVPHKLKAPFNDNEFEIWAIAHACLGDPLPRVDRIFEIHKWDEVVKWGSPQAWAKHPDIPVYLIEPREDVPNSVKFPFEELEKKYQIFEHRQECYFTNSISEMVALALDEGFEEIHIYGVNMSHSSEYCIHPETMVLMKDLTYRKAYEVNIGDEVIAFDENHADSKNERKFRNAKVQKVDWLTRPCYKLTFEDGSEVICSAEHRWLVHGGDKIHWIETERMRAKGDHKNDSCTRVIKPFEKWETLNTYESGYLAAAVDGEGHICQTDKNNGYNNTTCALGFSQRDNEMLGEFLKYSDQYNFSFNGNTHKDNCYKKTLTTRSEVVRFLGSVRPKRLLSKFNADLLGRFTGKNVALIKKEFIGDQKVIGFKTTTGTFIAEGFASHNSFQKPSVEYWLGLAKGLGKKIYVPSESDLCKSYFIYGRDEEKQTETLKKLEDRRGFLSNMQAQYSNNQAVSRDMMNKFAGAIEQWEFIKKNEVSKFESGSIPEEHKPLITKVIEDIDKKLKELTEEYNKHRITYEQSRDAINQHIGALEETKYMEMLMKQ